MLAELIYYYTEEGGGIGGDYDSVVIFIDGHKAGEWEDHYHDKGHDKAMGFIQGYEFAKGQTLGIVVRHVLK